MENRTTCALEFACDECFLGLACEGFWMHRDAIVGPRCSHACYPQQMLGLRRVMGYECGPCISGPAPSGTARPSMAPSLRPSPMESNSPSGQPTLPPSLPPSASPSMAPTDEAQRKCFRKRQDLVAAVDAYLADSSSDTEIALQYGWPIGTWCINGVDDMSFLFSAIRNPLARFFNADLSSWSMNTTTSMESMFHDARFVNFDASKWNVERVKTMKNVFNNAERFTGESLQSWVTSSVTGKC